MRATEKKLDWYTYRGHAREAIYIFWVADFWRNIWTCVESEQPNFRSINLGLGSVYGQAKVSLGLV